MLGRRMQGGRAVGCAGKVGDLLVGEVNLAGSRADSLESIHVLASTSNKTSLRRRVLVVNLLQNAQTQNRVQFPTDIFIMDVYESFINRVGHLRGPAAEVTFRLGPI
jgi:hypothetical protein